MVPAVKMALFTFCTLICESARCDAYVQIGLLGPLTDFQETAEIFVVSPFRDGEIHYCLMLTHAWKSLVGGANRNYGVETPVTARPFLYFITIETDPVFPFVFSLRQEHSAEFQITSLGSINKSGEFFLAFCVGGKHPGLCVNIDSWSFSSVVNEYRNEQITASDWIKSDVSVVANIYGYPCAFIIFDGLYCHVDLIARRFGNFCRLGRMPIRCVSSAYSSGYRFLSVDYGLTSRHPQHGGEDPQTTGGYRQKASKYSNGFPRRRTPRGFGYLLLACGLLGAILSLAFSWVISEVDDRKDTSDN